MLNIVFRKQTNKTYINHQGKGAQEHGGTEEKGRVHPEGGGDEG